MTARVTTLLLAAGFVLAGCTGRRAVPPYAPASVPASHELFQRSPGGTSEITPQELASVLAAGDPRVHVVDVREKAELVGELGIIPGAEWVPLGELTRASASWSSDELIVLVCRSGRRSARGAAQLESMGFRHVASLTGGMQRFHDLGLPVHHVDLGPVQAVPAPTMSPGTQAAGSPVQVDPAHVQWVRTATLLVTGSEACIDGRDAHAVVGTPGGDAGELLLALATAEQVMERALSEAEVSGVVTAWIDAFGRVYMHTDEHALAALGESLRKDARFASRGELTYASLEAFVRHPPQELEASLLPHLVEPAHVGCGHLRSMLLAPASYGIRHDLVALVLRALFEQLWRAPEHIDWVILGGVHHERAVVVVRAEAPIRPYTKVPAISPASALGQAFVVHPEVTAYLRQQHAHFLRDQLPALRDKLTFEALVAALDALANVQLDATLERLAPGLPWYEVRFPEGQNGSGSVVELPR